MILSNIFALIIKKSKILKICLIENVDLKINNKIKVIKYFTKKVFFFLEMNGFRGFTENFNYCNILIKKTRKLCIPLKKTVTLYELMFIFISNKQLIFI